MIQTYSSAGIAQPPAILSYADIISGMEIEYEDFWHSGILSWRKGVVEFVDYGATRIKGIVFPDRQRRRIFTHRMYQVRRPSR